MGHRHGLPDRRRHPLRTRAALARRPQKPVAGGLPRRHSASRRCAGVPLVQARRPSPACAHHLARQDGGGANRRHCQRHRPRRRALLVDALPTANCRRSDVGRNLRRRPGRPDSIRYETRARHQGLGKLDRRPWRTARPHGLHLALRPDILCHMPSENPIVFAPKARTAIRAELLGFAAGDPRISAAAITGSAADDREDRWSDIDLAFGIAEDITSVLDDWTARLYDQYKALHHLDIHAGPWLYRVFLLPGTLQVDLAFVPAAEFRALGPTFRVVFGAENEPQHTPP